MGLVKSDTDQQVRILVVDDDENLRLILADRLGALGHLVCQAASLAEALAVLDRETCQLVCLDVYLPDQQGLEGLQRIREVHPLLPVIIMTAHGTIDLAVEAMKHGAYDFVTKPMNFNRLDLLVKRVLENTQLRTEVDYLRRAADAPYSDIVGEDTGLKEVMSQVRQVAPTGATVLLRGETGTGKEVVARAIHRLSPRRHKPFVVANCAAIPRELMESEMFGHVRGAFTGAVGTHAGFFETAGGGTLLLDEVGDLDPDLQAKILRVLEEGSYRKVGSATIQQNRARVIASTHQPLEQLMAQGRFREDLFYRLNVFPIALPPLRQRAADIPALARHFLGRCGEGRPAKEAEFTREALVLLQTHPWRGNLRELRNCMERLALTVEGALIDADRIAPLLRASGPSADLSVRPGPDPAPICEQDASAASGATQPLKDLERQAILDALAQHQGNRTHAAAALGIGRRTLQNKLRQFGLASDQAED